MTCKECKATGEKSTVIDAGTETTCAGWFPYFDEQGRRHSHDPNRHSTRYNCSQGHWWDVTTYARCKAKGCDYGGDSK